MTKRQKKFAEYYAQSGNATQSMIKAGYSEKNAGQNADKIIKNPKVYEYIKKISKEMEEKERAESEKRILTAKERQYILSEIAADAENEPNERIKAIDTLNKMTGEYIVKIDAEIKDRKNVADVLEKYFKQRKSNNDSRSPAE